MSAGVAGQAQERLLHDVFGGVAVVDEQAGEAHERPTVGMEQPDDEVFRGGVDHRAAGASRVERGEHDRHRRALECGRQHHHRRALCPSSAGSRTAPFTGASLPRLTGRRDW